MAEPSPPSFRCPSCRRTVEGGSRSFPFCSPRCREVDLGNWFLEKYRVARPLSPDDLDGDLPEADELLDDDGA